MKDDVNDEVSNGTSKTLIPSNGVLNADEVSKIKLQAQKGHATHFSGWIEKPISQSLIFKCSYVDDTIEGGL